jgi:hypothetical protein
MKNVTSGADPIPPAGAILASSLPDGPLPAVPLPSLRESMLAALKPKGACWYCNAPLDNIKRFCNKTCSQDYQNEEETFR